MCIHQSTATHTHHPLTMGQFRLSNVLNVHVLDQGKKSMQEQREPAQLDLEFPLISGVLTACCLLLQTAGERIVSRGSFVRPVWRNDPWLHWLFFSLNCWNILQSASLDMQPLIVGNQTNNGCTTLMGMLHAAEKSTLITQVAQITHTHSRLNFSQKLTVGCSLQVFLQERWRQQKAPPCSSRDLILAPEAAGGLSPIILAHTDAEERFNGHWSAYPLLGA